MGLQRVEHEWETKHSTALFSSQFSSVTQSCLTLCNPMNRNMPGLPVYHQLPEFTQTHVHRVGDAIQPSHPLSFPSPPHPIPPSIRVRDLSKPCSTILCCYCVASVVSNSGWPHRQQTTRLPRPWDSPGKNTGVGCHFLLQCMEVKSESEVSQSCPTLSDPMDCSPPPSIRLQTPWEPGGVHFVNSMPFRKAETLKKIDVFPHTPCSLSHTVLTYLRSLSHTHNQMFAHVRDPDTFHTQRI